MMTWKGADLKDTPFQTSNSSTFQGLYRPQIAATLPQIQGQCSVIWEADQG